MSNSGPEFSLAAFIASISDTVEPGPARPFVVHADELEKLPANQVPNPSELSVAGKLPTTTFEIFRQRIPAAGSTDMHRHLHETVHFVISGHGHTDLEDESESWATGDFIYTPPWTWHRHFNDSDDEPVELLTVENSRLLGLLGISSRQSAGQVSVDEARRQTGGSS
jgi:quercetin dioxygenase-like cupin family protein